VFYLIDKMKYLLIFSLLFNIWGCTESSPFLLEKPEKLIPEKKFKKILSELILAEIMVQLKTTSPKQINAESFKLSKTILSNYKTDSLQFTQSFNYYSSDKDEMEKIYNSILEKYQTKRIN
jgi:hypothetical protein